MALPIVLVTCETWPRLSPSDECLAAALRARGRAVEAAPWNGPLEPFTRAQASVIRATWDYHEAPAAYLAWLERLDAGRTFNAPALVRWNLSKRHLLDLAARGAAVPRTLEVAADARAVAGALERLGVREAVLKPLIGASGFGVERVTPGQEAIALGRALIRKRLDRVLVQELLPEVAGGELAGVFFDGVFSHALRRVPAPGEFRVNAQYGGRMETALVPPDVVEQMRAILALLPAPALYARLDGIVRAGRFVLMEVEVNEPGLGLDLVVGAADRFADALLARIDA